MDNNALITYKDVSTTDILKNPNDFLDGTLRQLLLQTEIDPNPLPREVIFSGKGERLSHRDAHIVIQKLIKDGYVGSLTDKEWYYITFDGAKFIKEGGYTKAFFDSIRRTKYEKTKDRVLVAGSLLAAVGTFSLVVVEIWKIQIASYTNGRDRQNLHLPHTSIEFLSLVCVFAAAGILSTILFLLIKPQQKTTK